MNYELFSQIAVHACAEQRKIVPRGVLRIECAQGVRQLLDGPPVVLAAAEQSQRTRRLADMDVQRQVEGLSFIHI